MLLAQNGTFLIPGTATDKPQASFLPRRMWSKLLIPYQINTLINKSIFPKINVHGSVHRKYILIYIQQDATLHGLFISGNCSTCFGWYLHPSSGAQTTVFTASGICHTVTATCRYRGRVGTQFQLFFVIQVLWLLASKQPQNLYGIVLYVQS